MGSQLAIFQGLFLLIVLIALVNDDVDVDVLRLIRRCSCRAAAVEEIAEPGGNLKKLVALWSFLLFCFFFLLVFQPPGGKLRRQLATADESQDEADDQNGGADPAERGHRDAKIVSAQAHLVLRSS